MPEREEESRAGVIRHVPVIQQLNDWNLLLDFCQVSYWLSARQAAVRAVLDQCTKIAQCATIGGGSVG